MPAQPARKPPTGAARWFFRLPIQLYRIHLGGLMGDRFLLLNHLGRSSGILRQAVVEVVRHDDQTDCYVIGSGFGEKSQWYQNLMAHPDASVVAGRRELPIHAARLSPEEGEAEMLDYARRHPKSAQKLSGYMGFPSDGSEETYRQVGRALPFVRLCPREAGSPGQTAT